MMPCTLIPINLHNPAEYSELRQQRIKCGWDSSDSWLQGWREKQDQKLKSFFWITIPSTSPSSSVSSLASPPPESEPESESEPEARSRIRAGHISLDSYAFPSDIELANPDKSVLTIQTFFILPEYQGGGLGRRAMEMVEAIATQEPYGGPNCEFVTVNTISKKYFYDERPEYAGYWERIGLSRPKFCNVEWYERLGYVCWKSTPRYLVTTLQGEVEFAVADFLRKSVRRRE